MTFVGPKNPRPIRRGIVLILAGKGEPVRLIKERLRASGAAAVAEGRKGTGNSSPDIGKLVGEAPRKLLLIFLAGFRT